MNGKRVFIRCLLFAFIGLLIEVFFTAGSKLLAGNWVMSGNTSPWMMPVYGLLGVLIMPIRTVLVRRGIPLPLRAVVYMIGIFVIEYVSGTIFRAFGLVIWDYSHYAYNLHGQITLMYAPFWFTLGLAIEPLYRRVDAVAELLAGGVR